MKIKTQEKEKGKEEKKKKGKEKKNVMSKEEIIKEEESEVEKRIEKDDVGKKGLIFSKFSKFIRWLVLLQLCQK